ncbi:unnamed protein product [Allacma fusca]|uniref:Ciliogenesis-associated TTC17-interacting protein N-terminal domain-containing protein n=1 Tax=Allacma fusca TaxID=39272 RepID=A0A8J2Q2M8_9HEXA|nr:unnamed protein product [Allacma fusca]
MNDPKRGSRAEEKPEPQELQVFDGSTLSDPIPTISVGDSVLAEKTPSRFSRFKRMNAKPSTQASSGGSMTITWFNDLGLQDVTNVDFPESLLMITESGSTVGKYYCSVKRSLLLEDQCVLVHFGSCSTMPDGLECGITVTGFVDENLQTIQEYTHEWMKLKGKSLERKFVQMRELDKNQYFCKNTVWENGAVREERNFTVELSEMKHVISESANVILQRIMILQKKTGQIELKALTAKGVVVRSAYSALGDGVENIRGEDMSVRGLRRTTFEGKNGEEWDSIFNEHGRMVLRCQPDKDHALIPLWFKPVEKYTTSGDFIGTRPPLVWACDMEMYAQYIERKDLLVSQHKNYLVRHPMVKALLGDFLQALLQKKPKKLVQFGMQFFEPYLHNQPELDLCLSDTDSDATIDEFEVIYPEPVWVESAAEVPVQNDEEEEGEEQDGMNINIGSNPSEGNGSNFSDSRLSGHSGENFPPNDPQQLPQEPTGFQTDPNQMNEGYNPYQPNEENTNYQQDGNSTFYDQQVEPNQNFESQQN